MLFLFFYPFLGFVGGMERIAWNKYKQARRENFISYTFENHPYTWNYVSWRFSLSSALTVRFGRQRTYNSKFCAIEGC
jgi:hypothetical protein